LIVLVVKTSMGLLGGSFNVLLLERLATTVIKKDCKRINFSKEDLEDISWRVVMGQRNAPYHRSHQAGGKTLVVLVSACPRQFLTILAFIPAISTGD
jgi:hypothetical protein